MRAVVHNFSEKSIKVDEGLLLFAKDRVISISLLTEDSKSVSKRIPIKRYL
jgi:hypothetical protein